MTKKILIIFPDEWLSHCPTVLNMADSLSDTFEVKVIATDNGHYKNLCLRNNNFEFVKMNIPSKNVLIWREFYKIMKAIALLKRVREYTKYNNVHETIAVDSVGLWVAQKVFKKCHFVSLELDKDIFFRSSMVECIESVIIQTEDRLHFLFERPLPNTFFIQNAPPLSRVRPSICKNIDFNGRLIYMGNVMPSHGIYMYLDTLENMKNEGLTLTIKGIFSKRIRRSIAARYGHLIQEGKVILDESYTSQDEIVKYLSTFSIGLCCYDFNLIKKGDFNYISCPSGKLFNCYAAGVPVVGSDITGLRSVKEFNAGILLRNSSVFEMQKAIENISKNFRQFRENCIGAAKYFDFEKAIEPYKRYLAHK